MLEAFSALSLVHRIGVVAAGFVALAGIWLVIVSTHDAKVVQKERVRVEAVGSKIDAKAQQKRAAAESKPDLSRWMRD